MKQESLKNRIVKYLQKRDYFVASGDLQRLAQENGYYSPQNTGHRLRELANDGIIKVEYRKGHAWYKYAPDFSGMIDQTTFAEWYNEKSS